MLGHGCACTQPYLCLWVVGPMLQPCLLCSSLGSLGDSRPDLSRCCMQGCGWKLWPTLGSGHGFRHYGTGGEGMSSSGVTISTSLIPLPAADQQKMLMWLSWHSVYGLSATKDSFSQSMVSQKLSVPVCHMSVLGHLFEHWGTSTGMWVHLAIKTAFTGTWCIPKVTCGPEENVTVNGYIHILLGVGGTWGKAWCITNSRILFLE